MKRTEKQRKRLRKRRWLKGALVIGAGLFLILGAMLVYRKSGIREDIEKRRAASVKEAILNAAFQCYAVEGVYPEDMAYLQEYYGLMVNTKRYFISYDCCASNEPPEVMVLKK